MVVLTEQTLSKVIDVLKTYSINFEVANECRYTFINNNYQKFLSMSYEALDKEVRINGIVKKIERLDSEKLDKLLKLIEDFLHE